MSNIAPLSGLDSPGDHGDRKQVESHVLITQQDAENTGRPHVVAQSYGFYQRAGRTASAMAAGSLLLIGAFIGFLSWLWYGDRSEASWRRLMLGGWSNQAVTIASLVLRFALSTLGGTATAMIASVALERSGSSLRDAVSLSIARFTSPSPTTFASETLTHRHFIPLALRALLLLLILSTFAVQFSSTILLSDLDMGRVRGFPNSTMNATGYSWEKGLYGKGQPNADGTYGWEVGIDSHHSPFENEQEYFRGLSRVFNTFAELRDKPAVSRGDDQIIDDTGRTLRSFLPINDQNIRQNLMRYSGPASVFDARVVCVRPEIITGSILKNPDQFKLTIKVPPTAEISELTTTDQEFTVNVPRRSENGALGWHIVPLPVSVGGMLSSLDAASRQNITLSYEEYNGTNHKPHRYADKVDPSGVWRTTDELACGVDLGNAYLVMDTSKWPSTNVTGLEYQVINEFGQLNRGPWLDVGVSLSTEDKTDHPAVPDQSLGWVSVCFDSLPKSFQYHHIQDFNITATGYGNQSEPLTSFRIADEQDPLDVLALRRQLAATQASIEDDLTSRGVLSLDTVGYNADGTSQQWEKYCTESSKIDRHNREATTSQELIQYSPNIYNQTSYPWLFQLALFAKEPIAMCTGRCRQTTGIRASTTLGVILVESLSGTQATGSLALAMQAMLTQLLRDVYYTWIIRFDNMNEVEIVPSVAVLIPVGYTGFWIVMGIVLLHLGLCLTACAAFAKFTHSSRLGNGWQAVADIVNHEDGRQIIERIRELDGDQLKKQLDSEAGRRRPFVVSPGY